MAFSPDAYISPRSFIDSGKATVPGLFKWHARSNPSVDAFRFYSGNTVEGVTYTHVDGGTLRAARRVSSFLGPDFHRRHVIGVFATAGTPPPLLHPRTDLGVFRVGISDSITYATVILGIYRTGHVAFPISPRNSPAAVADLLRKTKTAHIMVSQDAHIVAVVRDALAELDYTVSQHPMPRFEDLYPAGALHDTEEVDDDALEGPAYDAESPALILHSSGV